jgi:signal transduction histidine kinase/uncharacterized protein YoaH (UPF0181 family)
MFRSAVTHSENILERQDSATGTNVTSLFVASSICEEHIVQFYENERFLVHSIARYISTGISQGEAVVIIATNAHLTAFKNELPFSDAELELATKSGQLVLVNAEEMLNQLMVDGYPDWDSFYGLIAQLMREAHKAFPKIRAYGELVDLLRAQGNLNAMIRLEDYWNVLSKEFGFSHLCAYWMPGFHNHDAGPAFEKVCQRHLKIVPSESFALLDDDVSLYQKAVAWQTELAERKRVESSLIENEKLLKAVITARDEFISLASHELKTPLTALMLQFEVQKRRLKRSGSQALDVEAMKQFVDAANHHASQMGRLIEDMLDGARLSNGKLELIHERVDLGLLVQETLQKHVKEIQDAGAAVTTTVDPAVIGSWDRSRIEQVISHLLSNALKYGQGKPVQVSVWRKNGQAVLEVSDSGMGISPDEQDRIFDRFARAVSSTHISGLGLGLYICRKVVELHDGQIWVESKPGEGSTFTVSLPALNDC